MSELVYDLASMDLDALGVIHYPDPRLAAVSRDVSPEEFTPALEALIQRMFVIMQEAPGVGLAAPQVGLNLRFFVANITGNPEDDKVYVNPVIVASSGSQEHEEGCLSLPDVACRVKRAARVTVRALDVHGNEFEESGEGLEARMYQHEIDHLDGRTLVDRMSTVARLGNRRALKRLVERFAG